MVITENNQLYQIISSNVLTKTPSFYNSMGDNINFVNKNCLNVPFSLSFSYSYAFPFSNGIEYININNSEYQKLGTLNTGQRLQLNNGNNKFCFPFLFNGTNLNQNQKVNNLYNKNIDSFTCYKNNFIFDIHKCEIDEFKQKLKEIKVPLESLICTKKGSKDIIKMIGKYPNQCITIIIMILKKKLSQIMKDTSGNYFCQNLIQRSNTYQLELILNYIKDDFILIAKDYQGTHVLQTLIGKIKKKSNNIETTILNIITNKELEMALDLNASHVLQKVLMKIKETKRPNINEIILSNFCNLATNPSGVCCLKAFIISNITPFIQKKILTIIENNILKIANDCYANYVIKTIFQKWGLIICSTIVNSLIKNICVLSIKKISANVSKNLIEILDDYKFQIIVNELFYTNKFSHMIKNKYGRYVLQNCIERMEYNQKKRIYELIDKNDCFLKNESSNKEEIMNSLFKNKHL